MSNIFKSLAMELSEVERQTNGITQLTEHAMTSRLLCLYLGWDWYERHIAFRTDPDEWMHNLKDDSGRLRIIYHARVVRLDNAMFTLLKGQLKGLDILKRRFLTRSTKPCFVEAEIASMLVYNGFEVEVIQETGRRGEDFDLTAVRDGVTLSIEVTSKDDQPLTVNTIRNTLKQKRTQVPANRPAVLYMLVPSEWMQDISQAQAIFTEAFTEFFERSRRFNAIILLWEDAMPLRDGFLHKTTVWGCYNNRPRHPYLQTNLLEPTRSPDGRVLVAYSFLEWLKSVELKMH